MRIVVAGSFEPFVQDPQQVRLQELCRLLKEDGQSVDCVNLPFVYAKDTILQQIVAMRLLDLTEVCDRLVAYGPPAHVLRHPHKILWMADSKGLLAEQWSLHSSQDLSDASCRIGQRLEQADELGLSEARQILCTPSTSIRVPIKYRAKCDLVDFDCLSNCLTSDGTGSTQKAFPEKRIERQVA